MVFKKRDSEKETERERERDREMKCKCEDMRQTDVHRQREAKEGVLERENKK